jgi:hypothetical protein
MNKINYSLTIGTIGILCTSIIQIITTIAISSPGYQFVFYILYPVFLLLLLIGYRKIVNE